MFHERRDAGVSCLGEIGREAVALVEDGDALTGPAADSRILYARYATNFLELLSRRSSSQNVTSMHSGE
jgi:hypothetical protein